MQPALEASDEVSQERAAPWDLHPEQALMTFLFSCMLRALLSVLSAPPLSFSLPGRLLLCASSFHLSPACQQLLCVLSLLSRPFFLLVGEVLQALAHKTTWIKKKIQSFLSARQHITPQWLALHDCQFRPD